jgi:hypothetical protein
LVWLTAAALVGSGCSRISDPVGNAMQGINDARMLAIETRIYQHEHGHFPDLVTVIGEIQKGLPGGELYVPSIDSVENHHPRIYYISTLAATDGQFVFASSAPFRRDYSSRYQLYRIVVPAAVDASGKMRFLIKEEEFQEVLAGVQQRAVSVQVKNPE